MFEGQARGTFSRLHIKIDFQTGKKNVKLDPNDSRLSSVVILIEMRMKLFPKLLRCLIRIIKRFPSPQHELISLSKGDVLKFIISFLNHDPNEAKKAALVIEEYDEKVLYTLSSLVRGNRAAMKIVNDGASNAILEADDVFDHRHQQQQQGDSLLSSFSDVEDLDVNYLMKLMNGDDDDVIKKSQELDSETKEKILKGILMIRKHFLLKISLRYGY
ncbi:hypothetical protein Glove_165g125 [Diversispora epigaea]|uniref:Uncharacterized protein n=1 Tax=Diversispora epigaea TaxID=1348612 RepID=A0A397IZT2_9GLOM|nr:hypothetical protein Glove_165g125 [Diversispora epigaea]